MKDSASDNPGVLDRHGSSSRMRLVSDRETRLAIRDAHPDAALITRQSEHDVTHNMRGRGRQPSYYYRTL